MNIIWLSFVRAYISVGMFFYFRRIKINDAQNLPKNKPVLLLSNHQNALLDALLIATKSRRNSYFLTRAGVFKKPFVAKILKSLQMLPVYRIRDGWGSLTNNNAIFESCSELLNEDNCIVIFPEGNHNLKRTVRPLSKGFTRIVLDTYGRHPEIDLQLLPVGVNYANAEKFPDSTTIYFGEPIAAKNYISDNNNNKAILKLKTKIHYEIANLTTHISKANYQDTLNRLEKLDIDFLNPKAVNACIASNFQDCKALKKNSNSLVKIVFKVLLIIAFILPYLIWKLVAKPKIKDIEFVSTFRFALSVTLAPLWLICVCGICALIFSWKIAVAYLIISLVIALFAVKL